MILTNEETDMMIIRQIIRVDATEVFVVSDDTDVFVLVCHFVSKNNISGNVWIISSVRGRSMISINCSVADNQESITNLLAIHGLTGCDTVAPYYGIGNVGALKVLKKNYINLDKIGDTDNPY